MFDDQKFLAVINEQVRFSFNLSSSGTAYS